MTSDLNFNSQFADGLRGFILEKRGLGCKYKTEAATLRLFDEYVCSSGYKGMEISKELFEEWTNRRSYEREKTCENRANILTQFCKYIVRIGGQAYIPLPSQRLRRDVSYRPYIFTNEELSRFLKCTKNMPGSMQRKTVFYMLFSLLICTGLRLGEALRLKWLDINWNSKPMMVPPQTKTLRFLRCFRPSNPSATFCVSSLFSVFTGLAYFRLTWLGVPHLAEPCSSRRR